MVPPYCTTASGRVYRLLRTSEQVTPDRVRYVLRAQPITADGDGIELELSRELDTELVRDKIANGQAIPTPETTYEELWQQLRRDIDSLRS